MLQRADSTFNAVWLALLAFFVLHLLAAALDLEPPPVPLDPEGHSAPFCDTPFFGI